MKPLQVYMPSTKMIQPAFCWWPARNKTIQPPQNWDNPTNKRAARQNLHPAYPGKIGIVDRGSQESWCLRRAIPNRRGKRYCKDL